MNEVLVLLLKGWIDLEKVQEYLEYSDEQMDQALEELQEAGFVIKRHSIH